MINILIITVICLVAVSTTSIEVEQRHFRQEVSKFRSKETTIKPTRLPTKAPVYPTPAFLSFAPSAKPSSLPTPVPATSRPTTPTISPTTLPSARPQSYSLGVDTDILIDPTQIQCMEGYGVTFFVARGFVSSGNVDSNVCNNLDNAYSAKMKYRDVYMIPCPNCTKPASQQMNQLVSYIQTNCNTEFSGRIWLVVESSHGWSNSASTNQQWYESLTDACSGTKSISCGVFSSFNDWVTVFGTSTFSYNNQFPLWYVGNSQPNFIDYVSFGGWTSPYAKQYESAASICGVSIGQDWAPSYSG